MRSHWTHIGFSSEGIFMNKLAWFGKFGRNALVIGSAVVFATQLNAATLSFTLTVTDFSDPTHFIFAFSTPLNPGLSGPVNVTANATVTVTDGGSNGAKFTGAGGSNDMWGLVGFTSQGGTSLGVEIADVCEVAQGGSTSPGGGTKVCTFSGSSTLTWPSLEQSLFALVSFDLTGENDMAQVVGTLTVEEATDGGRVPEPGSVLLVGAALAALGLARRRFS
jgi:PEP-CTERM motif